jgi:hypothetical protein
MFAAAGVLTMLVGVWDIVLAGAICGMGVLWTSHRWAARLDRRGLSAGIAVLIITAAVAEAGARRISRPPPVMNPEELLRLWMPRQPVENARFHYRRWDDDSGRDMIFAGLFPDLDPRVFDERTAKAVHSPTRVLHVGDSMVFGMGVEMENAFPALLEQAQPGATHINAGLPGAGPDVYWRVAQDWTRRLPAARVVLYISTGNDLTDLDTSYPFCGGGPLLAYDGDALRMRCPEPKPGSGRSNFLKWYVRHSPPPYPLRVAALFSSLGAHTLNGFLRLRTLISGESRNDIDVAWNHFERVLRATHEALRERSIPMTVVILPNRFALEGPPSRARSEREVARRIIEICHAMGAQVLDATDHFESAMRGHPDTHLFLDYGGRKDGHFSRAGHQLLADWLKPLLPSDINEPNDLR